ncbi:Aste57867_13894 [Aphanomyces stellatus]|uniref:Aste57867_13894 protein n=1 Tax=Aphanomyces stellatus TaxID=120398 RepID=A0A485KZN7_9STRA|nr:hypothetical protein As57867_013843 [Aphanomyces stellatus]VFT90725.1 Aste57867_13894 [Aphanomyces stellatus]
MSSPLTIHLPKASSALLVIDVQEGFRQPPFADLERSTPEFEANVDALLAAFRGAARHVIHVHHNSTEADSPFHPSKASAAPQAFAAPRPTETVLIKKVHSAFIGTSLESLLRDQGIDTLVIAGLTTTHCISTTTRMAGNLGFKVYVPCDAVATFEQTTAPGSKLQTLNFDAETVQEVELGLLHNEFATVVETNHVVDALALP